LALAKSACRSHHEISWTDAVASVQLGLIQALDHLSSRLSLDMRGVSSRSHWSALRWTPRRLSHVARGSKKSIRGDESAVLNGGEPLLFGVTPA
jgi:hypothetical protein